MAALLPWGLAALPGGGVLAVRVEDYGGLAADWLAQRLHPLDTGRLPPGHAHRLDISIGGAAVMAQWADLPPPAPAPGRVTLTRQQQPPRTVVLYGGKALLAAGREHSLLCLHPLNDVDPGEEKLKQAHRLLSQGLGDFLALWGAGGEEGWLWLHASAVVAAGAAHVFLGPSGAGKSTLAARCATFGWPVLADDLCALRQDDHWVAPGPEPGVSARHGETLGGLWLIGQGPQLAASPLAAAPRHAALWENRWGKTVLTQEVQLAQMAALLSAPVGHLTVPPIHTLTADALAAALGGLGG